jgi:hypothetical protein
MRYFIIYYSICLVMLIGLLPLAYLTLAIPNPYADIIAGEIGLLGGVIASVITKNIDSMLR